MLNLRAGVVICLKSLTFVVSITTYNLTMKVDKSCDLLEKSYLCGINNNSLIVLIFSQLGCDLLEKSYLCGINNNRVTPKGVVVPL